MLVEITPPAFDIILDIVYATRTNFTGAPVYVRPGCYLHGESAALLRRAIALACPHGLRFKIFDAFRPAEAQRVLWTHMPDRTPFDHFSPFSYHGTLDISVTAQRNRMLLIGLMTAAGWDFYHKEWWHYQMFNARRFPVLSDTVLSLPMMPC
ncbi:MAG: ddpX [Rhodospirillaceae bacterium]|nr:MAG: ddpX [Rhodospirillaceae bacterium]